MRQLEWRKSSHSSDQGGECVEVAKLATGPAVRDSKNPAGPVPTFTSTTWSAFTTAVRAGELE
jgi:hypothetical protein